MNVERINALADLIEKQPNSGHKDSDGFNMRYWTHSCGTPSCIAGWAVFLSEVPVETFGVKRKAAEFLGIEGEKTDRLFLPSDVDLDDVTSSHAAAVLRHLAKTGDVDWSVS